MSHGFNLESSERVEVMSTESPSPSMIEPWTRFKCHGLYNGIHMSISYLSSVFPSTHSLGLRPRETIVSEYSMLSYCELIFKTFNQRKVQSLRWKRLEKVENRGQRSKLFESSKPSSLKIKVESTSNETVIAPAKSGRLRLRVRVFLRWWLSIPCWQAFWASSQQVALSQPSRIHRGSLFLFLTVCHDQTALKNVNA